MRCSSGLALRLPMALLELAPAAAGAGIVALDAGKGAFQNRHHLPRLVATPEQAGHDLHGEIHVVEERFEPGAQIVQAGIAIRRHAMKRFFGHSP